MNTTADVIVVGSGIIGSSIAYYLAKKGVKNILVLEKNDNIGDGQSARNGGGVRQSGRDPRELPLAMYGIKNLWPHLSEELGWNVEYHQDGNLRLGKTEKHLEILRGLTKRANDVGLEVTMIDADEVKARNPWLTDEIIGASWCPTDGHANPMVTTLAFYRRARQMGVHYISGEGVTKLEKVKGKIRKVFTDAGNVYEAETVVLAAAYQSRWIAKTVGIDIPMNVGKLEALVTEAEVPMFNQMLGVADAGFYGHQCENGTFVFGGGSGIRSGATGEGFAATSSLDISAECRAVIGYIPKLKNAKIVRSWAGWGDIVTDGVPVIDAVSEVPGLYLACGMSGHGFGIGPAVGDAMSDLILKGTTPCDISGLKYDRFRSRV